MRAPTSVPAARPHQFAKPEAVRKTSGIPSETVRKTSGIARPTGGIPRPGGSRLPAPSSRFII